LKAKQEQQALLLYQTLLFNDDNNYLTNVSIISGVNQRDA
jgi:hypothetical protein